MAQKAATPNLFELAGGGVSVRYTTARAGGGPSFEYQDSDVTVTASADKIRTKKTEIGTLATIDVKANADAGAISVTVLLPTVNLSGQPERALRTVALLTTTTGSLGGSGSVVGQLQRYKSLSLRGTARHV